ncbi:MAG: nitroreductase family protein [Thermodesulfobacteriota bacterium]
MALLQVDPEKCQRDGICVAECPVGIIELGPADAVPREVPAAERLCLRCGHCVAVCPQGAMSIAGMRSEACPPIRRELVPSGEQVEQLLRSRRSIRSYLDREIEHGAVERLIDLARYAPTGTNSQQVHWLVVASRAEVQRLAGMAIDWMRHLVKIGDPAASRLPMPRIISAWESGADVICRGAPGLVITHVPQEYPVGPIDCAIALTFLDLAAPSFGFGTCWAGLFMFAIQGWPPLREALAVPPGRTPRAAMMIGYPRFRYHRLPLRKTPVITWQG